MTEDQRSMAAVRTSPSRRATRRPRPTMKPARVRGSGAKPLLSHDSKSARAASRAARDLRADADALARLSSWERRHAPATPLRASTVISTAATLAQLDFWSARLPRGGALPARVTVRMTLAPVGSRLRLASQAPAGNGLTSTISTTVGSGRLWPAEIALARHDVVSGSVGQPALRLDAPADGATLVVSTTNGQGGATILRVHAGPAVVARLTPPGLAGARARLASVIVRGQGIWDELRGAYTIEMEHYQGRLRAVAAVNTGIELRWGGAMAAYRAYRQALAAYHRRVAAYAHRVHLAQLARQQWLARRAAWDRYARQLAAYGKEMARRAARQRADATLVAGATPTAAPTELPPAWPGAPPAIVLDPGPEPAGLPLPDPPNLVPPWDGLLPPVALAYVGPLFGPGAAGIENRTQQALLNGGALDDIGAYRDPLRGVITTYWGGRTPFQLFHAGLDIAAPEYTPIRAVAAGVVVWARMTWPGHRHYSYGLCVVIRHNRRFETLYAHLDDQKYGLRVHEGDTVAAGQVIGYEGMTGWTTGPHLHFEIRQDNMQLDPLKLIPNPQA